jgi:hypothetical protein
VRGVVRRAAEDLRRQVTRPLCKAQP